MTKMLFLAVLAVLPLAVPSCSCNDTTPPPLLKIGAFNIQVFGPTKARKTVVMNNITKIVSQYDIMLIQEIRDKSGGCMTTLLNLLNKDSDSFAYVVSERLGRSSSKEQYAYYYKKDKVRIIDTRQFSDEYDVFEREPFSVLIEADNISGNPLQMVLTGVHTKPSDVLNEMNHMEDVYLDAKTFFNNTENMLIIGDMNADCSYLNKAERAETKLLTDSKYLSLIPNEADTTVSNTDCAYDRIMVAGQALQNLVYSYGVENFDDENGLSQTEAKYVSDHYPVWLSIRRDLDM